jgi:hypothetical protein
MEIYLLIEGKQEGPYSEDQVRDSLAAGQIPSDLPAWQKGLPSWVPVTNIISTNQLPPSVPPPFVPASFPPVRYVQSTAQDTSADIQPASYPWYRSSVLVALAIFIPWIMGPFLAVFLKPIMIAGLIVVASGPLYYKDKGELKTLPQWNRWLAGVLLLIAVPYYCSILWSASNSSSASAPILAALQQDAQLGKEYKSERGSIHDSGATGDDALNQVAQLTSNLVSRMKAIPIGDCPSEFQEAYTRHINCWSDYADAVAQHPHIRSGDEAVLEGFLRGLGGDPTGGAFQAQDEIDSYLNTTRERNNDVKRSWEEVEAVAIRYGVKPNDYSGN